VVSGTRLDDGSRIPRSIVSRYENPFRRINSARPTSNQRSNSVIDDAGGIRVTKITRTVATCSTNPLPYINYGNVSKLRSRKSLPSGLTLLPLRSEGGLRSWLACDEPARLRTGFQGSHSSRSGIRGPLHPPRHRSSLLVPQWYASVGRLAGAAHRPLVLGSAERNLEAGLTLPRFPTAGVTPGTAFLTEWGAPLLRRLRRTLPLRAPSVRLPIRCRIYKLKH